jgi:FkbM family methyltransferase
MSYAYEKLPRALISFNGKHFEVIYRYLTVDYDMYTSVMMEDAYRLQQLPIKPGMNAIDLGAHIGTVSLMLASMGANVYAVEVLPENVEIFKWNTSKNGYDRQIKIYQRAVASVSCKTIKAYYVDPVNDWNVVHQFLGWTEMCPLPQPIQRSIDVQTITIEDIFRENNLDHCHFLKVDIEGGEWDAFKDVPDEILQRIDIIFGEIHSQRGYTGSGEDLVRNDSLLPFFRGFFKNASMAYEDGSPHHGSCKQVGGLTNFYYIRKGLPIPLRSVDK